MSVSSKRDPWIDLARVLAMFFVMTSHTAGYFSWGPMFTQGGVMLFFLLAGYFAPKTRLQSWKRTRQMAVSWAAWSAVAALLGTATAILYPSLSSSRMFWDHLEVGDPLWFVLNSLALGEHPILVVMWFIVNLLVFQVIYSALQLWKQPPLFLRTATIILILSWVVFPWELPRLSSPGLFFFLTGVCLQSVPLSRVRGFISQYAIVLTAVVGAAFFLFMRNGASLDFPKPWTWVTLVVLSGGGTALLLAALSLASIKGKVPFALARMAPSFMWIYGAHIPFYRVEKATWQAVVGHPVELGWPDALIAMFALYGLYLVLPRLFPRIMAALCLGRIPTQSNQAQLSGSTSHSCASNRASAAD